MDRPGFDPADIAKGEVLLTAHAATFEPKVLRLGVTQGGRLLDRRWPEVMAAVSERRA